MFISLLRELFNSRDWKELPIKCKDTGEICKNYKEYLASRHWDIVKTQAFLDATKTRIKIDFNPKTKLLESVVKCPACNGVITLKNFVGHHLTYKRIGRERQGDVIPVCKKCHNGKSEWHRKEHAKITVPVYAKKSTGNSSTTPITA